MGQTTFQSHNIQLKLDIGIKQITTIPHSSSALQRAGGVSEDQNKNVKKLGKRSFVEQPSMTPDGVGMVKKDYDILKNKFSRLDTPFQLNPSEATFDDVALHALHRQRLSVSTVEKRLRYARFMAEHVIPVDFQNPRFENFIRHMDYRETFELGEGVGQSALSHEWKTMKMFLKAYGIPAWEYKPPSMPKSKARYIPLPDVAIQMIHHRYHKDDYRNALIQYTLLHSFIIGWRVPSEPCTVTMDDIDIDRGLMVVTEPKKHNLTRLIAPGYSILDGRNRKSFKHWIDHWRPKVANQFSGNALYLKPDGRPLTINTYYCLINRFVKPVNQRFTPYCSRHWCAIGSLIRTKLETKSFDCYPVRNYLGHSSIQTTMTYLRDAEQYMKVASYDWFQRVLKNPSCFYKNDEIVVDNTRKPILTRKSGVLTEFSPREMNGPGEI